MSRPASPDTETLYLSENSHLLVRNDFKLEIDWIKALPPGEETDIVLISCVGATFTGAEREKVAQAKRCGPTASAP